MRVNVYSQELTNEVKLITDEKSNTGRVYSGVRIYFHSSPMLHHDPNDDDRSGVTFWLPKSIARRLEFADALEEMAKMVRDAPVESP